MTAGNSEHYRKKNIWPDLVIIRDLSQVIKTMQSPFADTSDANSVLLKHSLKCFTIIEYHCWNEMVHEIPLLDIPQSTISLSKLKKKGHLRTTAATM